MPLHLSCLTCLISRTGTLTSIFPWIKTYVYMVLIRWYHTEDVVLLLTDGFFRGGEFRETLKDFNIEARRVGHIYEKPQFCVDGASSSVSL